MGNDGQLYKAPRPGACGRGGARSVRLLVRRIALGRDDEVDEGQGNGAKDAERQQDVVYQHPLATGGQRGYGMHGVSGCHERHTAARPGSGRTAMDEKPLPRAWQSGGPAVRGGLPRLIWQGRPVRLVSVLAVPAPNTPCGPQCSGSTPAQAPRQPPTQHAIVSGRADAPGEGPRTHLELALAELIQGGPQGARLGRERLSGGIRRVVDVAPRVDDADRRQGLDVVVAAHKRFPVAAGRNASPEWASEPLRPPSKLLSWRPPPPHQNSASMTAKRGPAWSLAYDLATSRSSAL